MTNDGAASGTKMGATISTAICTCHGREPDRSRSSAATSAPVDTPVHSAALGSGSEPGEQVEPASPTQSRSDLLRLEKLPDELLELIQSFLDYPSQIALSSTSKRLRAAIDPQRCDEESKLQFMRKILSSSKFQPTRKLNDGTVALEGASAASTLPHGGFTPRSKYGFVPCHRCFKILPAEKFSKRHRRPPFSVSHYRRGYQPFCLWCGRYARPRDLKNRKEAWLRADRQRFLKECAKIAERDRLRQLELDRSVGKDDSHSARGPENEEQP